VRFCGIDMDIAQYESSNYQISISNKIPNPEAAVRILILLGIGIWDFKSLLITQGDI
jgi:hypothetical protein